MAEFKINQRNPNSNHECYYVLRLDPVGHCFLLIFLLSRELIEALFHNLLVIVLADVQLRLSSLL